MGQTGRATKEDGHRGTTGAERSRGLARQSRAGMTSKKRSKKLRGVFEKVLGSDIWWIQYFDADGRRRREKAGRRGDAIVLLAKRKAEKLQGIKLPEKKYDVYRLGRLKEQFGNQPAEVPVEDLRKWMGEQT